MGDMALGDGTTDTTVVTTAAADKHNVGSARELLACQLKGRLA